MTLGAVTDVQHVDGAGRDDEQDPVSAGAPTVDQLPEVDALELPPETRQRFLHDNARRAFKLPS